MRKGGIVGDKIHTEPLIQDLSSASVYDPVSNNKLALLVKTGTESNGINRRERVLTENVFRERMQQIEMEGKIRFRALTRTKSTGDFVMLGA